MYLLAANMSWLTVAGVVVASLLITAVIGLTAYLAIGLFDSRSLIRREIAGYFASPVAYAVIVVFLAVTGWLFYLIQEKLTTSSANGLEWPIQLIFGDEKFWLVFLFIPSLLTMRLFAEERATGTLEVLMTAPVREWQIVLSKYVACLLFYFFMWLPTLVYLPVMLDLNKPIFAPVWTAWSITMLGGLALIVAALVSFLFRLGTGLRLVGVGVLAIGIACLVVGAWFHYGPRYYVRSGEIVAIGDSEHLLTLTANIDPMPVLSTYVGVALAGAMFLSIGMLISSLVRDQIVSAIVTLPVNLLFIVAGFWKPNLTAGNIWHDLVRFFSVPLHFSRDFSRGVVDTRHVFLYASVAAACLFFTIRSLESRRWR